MWARCGEISLLCLNKKSQGWVTYRLVAFGIIHCSRLSFPSGLEAISGLHLSVSLYTTQGASAMGGVRGGSHCEVVWMMGVSRR